MYKLRTFQSINRSGFTLVEFIIIISIFSIMAGILSFNFNGFRNSAGLNNLTHDLALSIYSIQKKALSGISIETLNLGTSASVVDALPYGIAFKKSTVGNGFDPEFIIFRDNNRDYEFSPINNTDTIIDIIKIQTSDSISTIETYDGSTYTAVPTVASSYFSIVFERPWSEVKNMPFGATSIRITVLSGDGFFKYITVSAIGQIAIQ